KEPEVLLWSMEKIKAISALSSRKDRTAMSAVDIKVDTFPGLLPHRMTATLLLSYLDKKKADDIEDRIKILLKGGKFKIAFESISDRPAMKERAINLRLAQSLEEVAKNWEIPLARDSSLSPSVGGLVQSRIPVVCGIGPASRDLHTPQEAVNRTSLIQRTLLTAQYLAKDIRKKS
ncbi:MAG: hypothetical protein SV775_11580, partial [Thermodesulfobacteriota bacterium]|nr:hypothetical protein [Thermodesulfobacteriota bacterium]